MLTAADRAALAELAPVLRRAADLDSRSLARLRLTGTAATAWVRLPFGVLVSRTVPAGERAESLDVTVRASELLAWLEVGEDAADPEPPDPRDGEWRTGVPPSTGWQRIEEIPDDVVRGLVRRGALALKEAAARDGIPGARPRSQVADALLDSTVLTVTAADGTSAEVSLRALSALTRMGFLPRGGHVYVDVAGRWVRVVAEYGTVHLERPGAGLLLH